MYRFFASLMLAFFLMAGTAYADQKASPLTLQQAQERLQSGEEVYSCSMKTDWFSDLPGQCPCCTMDLERVHTIEDGKAVFHDHPDMGE